ncbi:hypothetical protein DZF72_08020 [Vibrio parahaemolyticus]|uniref:hypothetical protein n=1 Tax=Vibrio TaxID=662 RepID=UPI0010E1DDF5|nr:hypothetical protein [Vibrio parahaemolyticus]EGR2217637.1 hypothetical protein [Vibrio parahaemolyticus]MBE4202937.1 hypothetical protein [Vibrio parahaemolyticus]TBT51465.1 hypothetical protein D5E78_06600 [Vibrio parahaemolyticus]
MNRGDLVMVRNGESEGWRFAHFAHFCKEDQVIHVIANGATQWTERLGGDDCQRHLLDDEQFDWVDGYKAFPTEKYLEWKLPCYETTNRVLLQGNHTPNTPATMRDIAVEKLRYGQLIQVRYEEGEDWKYAYLDRFWDDGRVQVLALDRSPFTAIDGSGRQFHEVSDNTEPFMPFFCTYNFWRLPNEITDSGDLRDTIEYKKHWGLPLEIEEKS